MGFLALTTHVAYLFSPFPLVLSFLNRSIFYFFNGSVCVFSHVCAHVHGYETRGWWVSPSAALHFTGSHADPQCLLTVLLVLLTSLPRRPHLSLPPAGVTGRLLTSVFMWVLRTWLLSSLAQISLNFTNQIFNVYHIRKCLNKLSLLMYF